MARTVSSTRTGAVLALVLALALALALASTGACTPKEPAGETPAEQPGDAPAEGAGEPEAPAGDGATEPDDTDGSTTPPSGETPETVTVRLYWVSAGENALGVERTVPYTAAVATAAMRELLAGPTAAEKATWPAIATAIPAGTRLLGLSVADGVARVDLSGEYASGGGTFGMTARLAQVVYTLTQFPTVDAVEFYLDGERVRTFSGEGIILDGPQRPADYYDLLPVDA